MTAKFRLNGRLDDTRQHNEPQQDKAGLGTELGGHDQLARPDDRTDQDQAGTQPAHHRTDTSRRFEKRLRIACVRVSRL